MSRAEWLSIDPVYRWILVAGGVRPEPNPRRGTKKTTQPTGAMEGSVVPR